MGSQHSWEMRALPPSPGLPARFPFPFCYASLKAEITSVCGSSDSVLLWQVVFKLGSLDYWICVCPWQIYLIRTAILFLTFAYSFFYPTTVVNVCHCSAKKKERIYFLGLEDLERVGVTFIFSIPIYKIHTV